MTDRPDVVVLSCANGDSCHRRACLRNGSGPSAPTPEPHNECSLKGKQTQNRAASTTCNTPAPGRCR